MTAPSYSRSLMSAFKRLKISPSSSSTPLHNQSRRHVSGTARQSATVQQESPALSSQIEARLATIRLPKAVQATYLAPLRRAPTHNVTSADLQLRSYSVRNLEVFADFAMRAAYYLKLAAKGPVPLRRIVERWTVPRSNFVHKKSQENFERKTLRRAIRVVDGHPQTVALWLAYLRKHQYYGVGLKADVYEHTSLDVEAQMDRAAAIARRRAPELRKAFAPGTRDEKKLEEMLFEQPFKAQYGAYAAMGGAESVPAAAKQRLPTLRMSRRARLGLASSLVSRRR